MPHVGALYEGGRRWIVIFHVSFQPSELLKIGSIIIAAAYFRLIKDKVRTIKYGLGGLCAILAFPVLLLVAQPDIGTLLGSENLAEIEKLRRFRRSNQTG